MAFEWLFGDKPKTEQLATVNPQQNAALDQILKQALSGLQNQRQFDFAPIEQKVRSDFETKTLPTIAERFASSLQGQGRLGSSGFGQILSEGRSNLDEYLASLMAQYNLQQQGQQNQLYSDLLRLGVSPRFENIITKGSEGLLNPILRGASGALVGGLMGGVPGAVAGGFSGFMNKGSQQPSAQKLGGVTPNLLNSGQPLMPNMQTAFLKGGI